MWKEKKNFLWEERKRFFLKKDIKFTVPCLINSNVTVLILVLWLCKILTLREAD